MTTTIALAIPHCPWIPERVASMARLREQLGHVIRHTDAQIASGAQPLHYREFTDREPNRVWSERLWTWLASTDASHVLVLQDDVIVAPNFWPALQAMIEAFPNAILGLAAVHPSLPTYAEEGHRWVTTREHIIGWAYAMPRVFLIEFLQWRATALKEGALDALHEDDLLGCWALVQGSEPGERGVYHPIPTIVQHDTTIESSYANDDHANRRAPVTWDRAWKDEQLNDLQDVRGWKRSSKAAKIPHLGLGYPAGNIARACARWVIGFDEAKLRAALSDTGMGERRRMTYVRRARPGAFADAARIFVATPDRGVVHPAHQASLLAIMTACEEDLLEGTEIIAHKTRPQDLVHARNVFLREALETDCTHVWMFDADVACSPSVLRGMLRSGHGVVATPYARRDENAHRPMLGILGDAMVFDEHHCTPIRWAPLGCTLLRRDVVEQMTDYYRAELRYDEIEPDGLKRETVALFLIGITDDRRLPSEDQCFFSRARAMGIQPYAYFGTGSPADHWGDHCYRGNLEDFGIRRIPA